MEKKKEIEWKSIENGKLEGIVEKSVYKNGKREGEWKFYRENGKLEQIENFKNGKEEGEWKVYHENGKLEKINHFLFFSVIYILSVLLLLHFCESSYYFNPK